MKPTEYLSIVARTIATHGHRDYTAFQCAAANANQYSHYVTERVGELDSPEEIRDIVNHEKCVQQRAKEIAEVVREQIKLGLAIYLPGEKYFNPVVAVEYATLVAKFNSVE